MISVNDYQEERTCMYKDEEYIVRDNGAVLRKPRSQNRVRKNDNVWTFGKPNQKNGYMEIASVRVHRIVAIAFHGRPPTKDHVVDHIDTNRQNNRPNNLRWLTRLENVVLNEITRKKIEYLTGVSIHEFLKNPVAFRDCFENSNFSWMRTVTNAEAESCLQTFRRLTEKENVSKRKTYSQIGEWIYGTHPEETTDIQLVDSLTPTAKQKNWRTPCEFPCCPLTETEDPIESYYKNLSFGKVFAVNQYGESTVEKLAFVDKQYILVITDIFNSSKVEPFALSKITYENGYFLHASLGTFFTPEGAEKEFVLEQGLEWTGGATLDDFC